MTIIPSTWLAGRVSTIPGSGVVTVSEFPRLSIGDAVEVSKAIADAAAVAHASTDYEEPVSSRAKITSVRLTSRKPVTVDMHGVSTITHSPILPNENAVLVLAAELTDESGAVSTFRSTGPRPSQALMEMLDVWTLDEAVGHEVEVLSTSYGPRALRPVTDPGGHIVY